MAGEKEIRNKIRSVNNMQKITSAMEKVAASKIRKAISVCQRTVNVHLPGIYREIFHRSHKALTAHASCDSLTNLERNSVFDDIQLLESLWDKKESVFLGHVHKKIVKMVGGNPDDVPGVLALYGFPTLAEQASAKWLGGGKDGGAARALFFTSEFLKAEKKIDALQPDYGEFVTSEFVDAALKMK